MPFVVLQMIKYAAFVDNEYLCGFEGERKDEFRVSFFYNQGT
jgi:hypothetical protein